MGFWIAAGVWYVGWLVVAWVDPAGERWALLWLGMAAGVGLLGTFFAALAGWGVGKVLARRLGWRE